MGFRDSNQDLIGFVHQIPKCARERIIDVASTQFSDGSAYHQYQPLPKKGNNCLPKGITSCTINRKYRGAECIIMVNNKGGTKEIDVDGGKANGNIITADKDICQVTVNM